MNKSPAARRLPHSRRASAWAAVLLAAFATSPRLAADEAEDLRSALVQAYERQATVNLAWAGSAKGVPLRIELFHQGPIRGLQVHAKPSDDAAFVLALSAVTDGTLLAYSIAAGDVPTLPGVEPLNRAQARCEAARVYLETLGVSDVPKLATWIARTDLWFEEASGSPEFLVHVDPSTEAPAPGWLSAKRFGGRTVRREGSYVVLTSPKHRTRVRLDDGAPESIEQFEVATDKPRSEVHRVPSERSTAQWVSLIQAGCKSRMKTPRVELEFAAHSKAAGRLARAVLERHPELVRSRGSQARSLVDVVCAVLFATEGLDDWVRSERAGADADAAARSLWEPFWHWMELDLHDANLDAASIEALRIEFWGNLWERTTALRRG